MSIASKHKLDIEKRRKGKVEMLAAAAAQEKEGVDNLRIERLKTIIECLGLDYSECDNIHFIDEYAKTPYAVWEVGYWKMSVRMEKDYDGTGKASVTPIIVNDGGNRVQFDLHLELMIGHTTADLELRNSIPHAIKSERPYPLNIAYRSRPTIPRSMGDYILTHDEQLDYYLGAMWDIEQSYKNALESLPAWRSDVKTAIEAYDKEMQRIKDTEIEEQRQWQLEKDQQAAEEEQLVLAYNIEREQKHKEHEEYLASLEGQFLTVIKDMSDEQLSNALSMITNEVIERKVNERLEDGE